LRKRKGRRKNFRSVGTQIGDENFRSVGTQTGDENKRIQLLAHANAQNQNLSELACSRDSCLWGHRPGSGFRSVGTQTGEKGAGIEKEKRKEKEKKTILLLFPLPTCKDHYWR